MRRAVFLSPVLSQPRFHRRAAMYLDQGFDITVYSFDRRDSIANSYPSECHVVPLGTIESRKYLQRIPHLLRAIRIIKKNEKLGESPPLLIHAFGLDLAVVGLAAFGGQPGMNFEVGDIQSPLPHRGILAKAIGVVEKYVLKRCRRLIVTSWGFVSGYYAILDPKSGSRTRLIENKLSRSVAARFPRPLSPKPVAGPVRLGFVGRLRYEQTLAPLLEAISKRPGKFEMHLHGGGPLSQLAESYAQLNDNIFHHGPFVSSTDLANIYNGIDINFVVYDARDPNVRMALPNKLYESPYFATPLVVASGTHLAERVKEWGVGFAIDPLEPGFADILLDKLSPRLISDFSGKALDMLPEIFVEDYRDAAPLWDDDA